MGTKYSIFFTNKANESLEEIYDYIAIKLYAKDSAKNLMKRLESGISLLEKYPFLGKKIFLNNKCYRKLVIGKYIVIYEFDRLYKQIIIHHIYYARRDYLK